LANHVMDCLGGHSPAIVVVAVTVDYVDKTAGCTDLGLSSDA